VVEEGEIGITTFKTSLAFERAFNTFKTGLKHKQLLQEREGRAVVQKKKKFLHQHRLPEAGSYIRRIAFCKAQLWAQGFSWTCTESDKEEAEEEPERMG